MNDNRPVNLDLFTIKQPLPAIASIMHRISGIILFVGIGILIYFWDQSLSSAASFAELQESLGNPFVKFILWGVVSALLYHFVAGIKHLFMDFGIGETLEGADIAAKLVIGISAVLIIFAGVCIW